MMAHWCVCLGVQRQLLQVCDCEGSRVPVREDVCCERAHVGEHEDAYIHSHLPVACLSVSIYTVPCLESQMCVCAFGSWGLGAWVHPMGESCDSVWLCISECVAVC